METSLGGDVPDDWAERKEEKYNQDYSQNNT